MQAAGVEARVFFCMQGVAAMHKKLARWSVCELQSSCYLPALLCCIVVFMGCRSLLLQQVQLGMNAVRWLEL